MCPASGGAAPERSAGASAAADAGRRVARPRAARVPRGPTYNNDPSVRIAQAGSIIALLGCPISPIAWSVV